LLRFSSFFGSRQDKNVSFRSAGMISIQVIPRQFSWYWSLKSLLSTRRSLKWRLILWKEILRHQRWYFQWIFVKMLKYYLEDFGVVLMFFRIYICAIFTFLLSLADATGRVRISYFQTSWSPCFCVANRAAIAQLGHFIVITAHFKPEESSTCFRTIKLVFYCIYNVSYNKLSIIGMLLWDLWSI
jgi:hypothetical protein